MHVIKFLCLQLVCLTIDLATADKNFNITIYPLYRTTTTPRPTTTATLPPIPTLPPGYTYHSEIRTAYKFHTDELDWSSAVDSCRSEGARLAAIDTQNKLQYALNLKPWLSWVWTGIYRESNSGQNWKAVDGGSISGNLPWAFFNPKLFGECVAVSGVQILTGLSNWSCSEQKMYVCEIPDYA